MTTAIEYAISTISSWNARGADKDFQKRVMLTLLDEDHCFASLEKRSAAVWGLLHDLDGDRAADIVASFFALREKEAHLVLKSLEQWFFSGGCKWDQVIVNSGLRTGEGVICGLLMAANRVSSAPVNTAFQKQLPSTLAWFIGTWVRAGSLQRDGRAAMSGAFSNLIANYLDAKGLSQGFLDESERRCRLMLDGLARQDFASRANLSSEPQVGMVNDVLHKALNRLQVNTRVQLLAGAFTRKKQPFASREPLLRMYHIMRDVRISDGESSTRHTLVFSSQEEAEMFAHWYPGHTSETIPWPSVPVVERGDPYWREWGNVLVKLEDNNLRDLSNMLAGNAARRLEVEETTLPRPTFGHLHGAITFDWHPDSAKHS